MKISDEITNTFLNIRNTVLKYLATGKRGGILHCTPALRGRNPLFESWCCWLTGLNVGVVTSLRKKYSNYRNSKSRPMSHQTWKEAFSLQKDTIKRHLKKNLTFERGEGEWSSYCSGLSGLLKKYLAPSYVYLCGLLKMILKNTCIRFYFSGT